jgi:hypothetical protein
MNYYEASLFNRPDNFAAGGLLYMTLARLACFFGLPAYLILFTLLHGQKGRDGLNFFRGERSLTLGCHLVHGYRPLLQGLTGSIYPFPIMATQTLHLNGCHGGEKFEHHLFLRGSGGHQACLHVLQIGNLWKILQIMAVGAVIVYQIHSGCHPFNIG